MYRYQDTLARRVQAQRGRAPQYADPSDFSNPRLERLPTFTPLPAQIEIKENGSA